MPARRLPPRPHLDQYRKQAKELLNAWKSGDPDARRRLEHARPPRRHAVLADAQRAIAREHGFENWAAFVAAVEPLSGEASVATIQRRSEAAAIDGDVEALERLIRDHGDIIRRTRPSHADDPLAPDYASGEARRIVLTTHHFEHWSDFARYRLALDDPGSPISRFEAAVDAVVSGDTQALRTLLERDPGLATDGRSPRQHHATLLHYAGANGVEQYRQRTPANAVEVASMLLEHGADVNASAAMYGGSTTLGLVATSVHPARAGVQRALIDLLLERGARLDHGGAGGHREPLVNACLANGRLDAALHLRMRGAPLDLEAACGVGALDVVNASFARDGSPTPPAAMEQLRQGMRWACEFGQNAVVELLAAHGIGVSDALPPRGVFHGDTPLHLAALGGHLELVQALLRKGAAMNARDMTFGTTPLGWALHGWRHDEDAGSRARRCEIVSVLVSAGADVDAAWLRSDDVQADPVMAAALAGRRV